MGFDMAKLREAANRFVAQVAQSKEDGYRLFQEEVDGLLLANWFLATNAEDNESVVALAEVKK